MPKEHLEVYVRVKPSSLTQQPLAYIPLNHNAIELQVPRNKLSNAKDNQSFSFSGIFQEDSDQQHLFEGVAKTVIENCLQGYNGTIFAYGQTGSGKTFTMSGGDEWQNRGIIPRVISHLFEEFQRRSRTMSYSLSVSFIEIYNQSAYDLLDQKHLENNFDQWTKITLWQDDQANLQVKNMGNFVVQNQQDALKYHFLGNHNRKINPTNLNQVSSRSHCIFTLNIAGKNHSTHTEVFSKLNLVDLAGSERVSKSMAEGSVLNEAKNINLSLSYLQQVIIALNQKTKSKGKGHIPYRNSLLTTFLKDSLGGNCKTAMIATISGDKSNMDETLSTLRFAQRVKLVENQMNKNQKNIYSSKIQALQKENNMLKRKVAKLQGESQSVQITHEDMKKLQKFMNDNEQDLQVSNLGQAKGYFKRMRQMYHSRLSEYVKQLTFISQKLYRYDQLISQKQRKK